MWSTVWHIGPHDMKNNIVNIKTGCSFSFPLCVHTPYQEIELFMRIYQQNTEFTFSALGTVSQNSKMLNCQLRMIYFARSCNDVIGFAALCFRTSSQTEIK